jgi:FlaA1/EpsC-like NDP-sugar epimerase
MNGNGPTQGSRTGTSKPRPFLRKRNFWIMLLTDVGLLALCYTGAGLLRFEGTIPPGTLDQMTTNLVPMIAAKLTCFFVFDLYRGCGGTRAIRDLVGIVKAAMAGTLLYVSLLALFEPFRFVSRGVILIDFLLTVVAIGGFRLAIRLYTSATATSWTSSSSGAGRCGPAGTSHRGHGHEAEMLMREIHENSAIPYHVVGFFEMEGSTTAP